MRNVGLLLVAVLHFVPGQDDPHSSVAAFVRQVPPGSFLALSHITSDGTAPQVMATIADAYRHASAQPVFRARRRILGFFAGTQLLDPGLVDVPDWYAPGTIRPPGLPALRFLAGIASKGP